MPGQTGSNIPEQLVNTLPEALFPNEQPASALLALVDEARVSLGWSRKEMAISAGVNEGTFSDAMNGKPGKNFALAWIGAQPREFHIAFHQLFATKFRIATASQVELLLKQNLEQLKVIEGWLRMTAVSK